MSNDILNYHAISDIQNKTIVFSKENIIKTLFVIGLLLTTAKGLRVGGDLGVGEVICLLFVLFSFTNKKSQIEKIYYINNLFWFTIFFTLFIGLFIKMNFTNFGFQFPRTLLAYMFCYIIILGIFKSNLLTNNILNTLKIYVYLVIIVSSIFSALILTGTKSVVGINLYWEGSSRFQGWSLDPNQFTLLYIIVPFLLLFLYQYSNRKFKAKLIYTFASILILIPVLTASSDSIIISWALGFLTILTSHFYKKLNLYKLLLFIISITLISLNLIDIFEKIKYSLIELFLKDGQGMTRLTVWLEAIEIIKVSPLFGLGPDMGRVTEYGGTLGEAHNNFLQLGMGSGIIGMLALLIYFLFILINVLKSKNVLLLAAFLSLFAFGLTHYTLRHPSYWFMILLIYSLSRFEFKRRQMGSNSLQKKAV